MHIPDGFLDTKTAIASAVLSSAAIGLSFRHLRNNLPARQVPMMGLSAAFIFVAQMLNFPVAGGTSGHLMGATLCSVLLGPSAALIVLSMVIIVQCFLFADGGLTALGANIFNMGVVGILVGYLIYLSINKIFNSLQGKFLAIAFASWCSIVTSSVVCAGELAWSGTAKWSTAFVAMMNVHMLIGIGEGIITTLVIAGIWKTRPELFENKVQFIPERSYYEFLLYAIILILGLLLFVLPFISKFPDGLEKVASTIGFDVKVLREPILSTPLADYQVSGIITPEFATIIAGAIGVVVVFILSFALAKIVAQKS